MRTRHWRTWLSLGGLSLVAAGTLAGCGETGPSRGGLMLVVATDGPLALDRLDIEIAGSDQSLLANKYRVPEELILPTTVAIVSNGNATAQATISVTGWAGSVPLDRRDAIVTQIPTDRVATLIVVLSARCSDKLTVDADGQAVSNCGDGSTCDNRGNCVTATVAALDLPTFHAGDEINAGIGGTSAVNPDSVSGSGGELGFARGGAAGAGGAAGESGAPGRKGAAGESGAGGEGGSGGSVYSHAPEPYCGDGTKNGTESCDDGTNVGRYNGCMPGCSMLGPRCGDALSDQSAGEQCDDGGLQTAACELNCKKPRCGDSVKNVNAGEQCDDGAVQTAVCEANCKSARCGDTVVNQLAGEACDSGGLQTANCEANCKAPRCGDSIPNPYSEQCDSGGVQSASCEMNCKVSRCGDAKINVLAGEDCDEGVETKACTAKCKTSRCGDGYTNPTASEQCDTGGDSATCNADCTTAKCGDNKTNKSANEDCDTGGVNFNTCNANCKRPVCGDGYVNSAFLVRFLGNPSLLNGEQCEPVGAVPTAILDRASIDTPDCDRDCTTVRCGDGYVNVAASEECDPVFSVTGQQLQDRSDCDNDCTLPVCGDGHINTAAGEQCDPPNTAKCDVNCKNK